MVISARRDDGSPVQKGDAVFVVWNKKRKSYGRVTRIDKPMRFTAANNQELQTYTIKCKDGTSRPAHAKHIKIVYSKKEKPCN